MPSLTVQKGHKANSDIGTSEANQEPIPVKKSIPADGYPVAVWNSLPQLEVGPHRLPIYFSFCGESLKEEDGKLGRLVYLQENDYFKNCFFFVQPNQSEKSAFASFIEDFPEIAFKDGKREEFIKMWMKQENYSVEYDKNANPFQK